MNRIINFHQVNDSVWFNKLIIYLKTKYVFISAEDLYESYQGSINIKNACHITVDDGDISFYDVIFPILKKFEVPATIFVSPRICLKKSNYWFQEVHGYNQFELKQIVVDMMKIPLNSLAKYSTYSILKTLQINQIQEIIKRYRQLTHTPKKAFQNMSINKLKEVEQSGLVTIGAHTINHPILRNEDDATSKYEIDESVIELSNLLNHEIQYFAYPNGIPDFDFSEREKKYLSKTDIKLAFTMASKNISPTDNTMSVPRFAISDSEKFPLVKAKLVSGSFWEVLKQIRPNGEYRERAALEKMISHGILL